MTTKNVARKYEAMQTLYERQTSKVACANVANICHKVPKKRAIKKLTKLYFYNYLNSGCAVYSAALHDLGGRFKKS